MSHCGADVPAEHRDRAIHLAVDVLEPIRARWQGPIMVVSWYRSPWHNKQVGGAPQSRHLLADGADIAPVNRARTAELFALIEQMILVDELPDLGGYGKYRAWVHVDCRPRRANGAITRWHGRGFGSEM
jgi:uncharacterized protein YcbK (DUF882 family)